MVISNPHTHTHTHSSLVVENKVTNDISWSIDGKGNIWPTDRSKVSGEITIPNTVNGKVVTGIANSAFEDCTLLTSVTFAEGSKLTSIDDNAFEDCTLLTSVTFAEGSQLNRIGWGAFKDCIALTSINIPSGVTSIGGWAFSGCFKLISITFAEGSKLTSIGKNAFWVCSALTSINIPSSVTSIGGEAFSYCPLTSIEFAGNQTYDWVPTAEGGNTVGGYIIQKGNDLSTNTVVGCLAYGKINIKLPDGKTSIIGNAFSCCSGITHIGISDNVTNIGWTAFWNCTSLTSIIIPSSITSIGKTAFGNCDKMGTITFNWNEEQLSKLTLGNNLIRNDTSSQTINFHIPWGTKDQYNAKFTQDILGTNVTANWIDDIQWSITDDGFISPANKDLIKGDVTIPNTVGGKVVTGIANSAFDSCTSLTSVNFDNDSQLTSIGYMAFNGCGSLKNITIPKSVTSFGALAFSKCALTSINIPSSVTSIGEAAFADCPLTSIKFTDNDTYKRFSTKSKDGEEIGAYVISKSQDLSTSTVAGCLAYGKINIELPDGKTSIIDNAFDWCSALTSINIPSSVTSIGDTAFSRCSSLKSVNFAEGSKLYSIGGEAFYDCTSLTSINIPNSVTSIDGRAFEDCYNLSDVYLNWDENQIKKLQIDDYVFDSTTKKITINFHIPKGMKELYIAKTKGWFNGSAVPNWIENNPPAPSSNSNLPLILGLTFGFIILIGIGSYLGYRYYKHRKAINKK
ncbi:BspA-like protein [Candidatus Malacoplasma girerdii]|uniref:BspA-like protein n=1 Tax=Candidatus Malacoplasma girerdii TaxID=1318617 RepID=A0A097ST25_9BACT|nr:BspA-like protein [Candidatus Malacoplasma girerdii]